MQKYFTSFFTDKKGYGLSQYNVEVCTLEDEIISRVRPEEYERNDSCRAKRGWILFGKI